MLWAFQQLQSGTMGGTADYGNYMEKHEEGKLGGDTRPGASITSSLLDNPTLKEEARTSCYDQV